MANIINTQNSNEVTETFDPKVDNSTKYPKPGLVGTLIWYLLFVLIIPIMVHVSIRNGLFKNQTRINEIASGIDVQLKRRQDILSKLLDATKNYMKYERNLLTDIVSLRNANITGQNRHALGEKMDSVFSRMFAVFENYPDLKTNQEVVKLMDAAVDSENEIAAARRLYNTEVRTFNEKMFTWPSLIIAAKLKLQTIPYFESTKEDRQDVKLDF